MLNTTPFGSPQWQLLIGELSEKSRETKSLLEFAPRGTIGKPGQDATAAWIEAEQSGYDIYVPPGEYFLTDSSERVHNQRWYTTGLNTVLILRGSVTPFNYSGDGLTDRGGSIEGFTIIGDDGTSNLTPGPGFVDNRHSGKVWSSSGVGNIQVKRLLCFFPYDLTYIDTMNSGLVDGVYSFGTRGHGINLFGQDADPLAIPPRPARRSDGLDVKSIIVSFYPLTRIGLVESAAGNVAAAADAGHGFIMDGNCGTVNGYGLEFVLASRGIIMRKTVGGKAPDFITITNFSSDFTYKEAIRLEEGTTFKCFNSYAHGAPWDHGAPLGVVNNSDNGVYIGPNFTTALFVGLQTSGFWKNGYEIHGKDWTILAPLCHNNSFESFFTFEGLWDGVRVMSTSSGGRIGGGGLIGAVPGQAATHGYGVRVQAGATNIHAGGDDVDRSGNIFGAERIEGDAGAGNVQFGMGAPLGTAIIGDLEITNLAGRNAHLSCTINSVTGEINNPITVVDGGTGFWTAPSIGVLGGGMISPPTLVANVANGVITSITIVDGGEFAIGVPMPPPPSLIVQPAFSEATIRPRAAAVSTNASIRAMGKGAGFVILGNDLQPNAVTIGFGQTIMATSLSVAFPFMPPSITMAESIAPPFEATSWPGGLVKIEDHPDFGECIAIEIGGVWEPLAGAPVGTGTIADGAVTTPKLADGAVTGVKVDPTFLATLVTLTGSQTLTNKTFDLGSTTLTGTLAQFNAALTGADFASLAGAETLTNKTINLTSNTFSGTTAQFNAALSDNDFATLAGTETLTNKTLTSPAITTPTGIVKGDVGLGNVDNTSDATKNAAAVTLTNKTFNLTNNTLTGTTAQFNTALSDGDFATLAGSETLTNKTISGGTFSGTIAGTPTFSGAITFSVRPTFNGNTPWDGGNLTLATQAEMEAGSVTTAYVAPGRQQHHKSAAKSWVRFDAGSGTPSVNSSYNVSSITDNGVGDFTVNNDTDFSDANYAVIGSSQVSNGTPGSEYYTSVGTRAETAPTASAARIAVVLMISGSATLFNSDATYISVGFFGDQ